MGERAGSARRAPRRHFAAGMVVALVTGVGVGATGPASAGGSDLGPAPDKVARTGSELGAKSPTSRLAQTDESLLGVTDPAPVNVVVKLDYDSIATYGGGVDGLAATSPEVTGRPLDADSGAARSYAAYARGVEDSFIGAVRRAVPAAAVGRRLRTVYGGVALRLPGNQVERLLELPTVVAVQRDAVAQPLTDASPAFVGAPTVYGALGTESGAGHGVIVGVLDTGAWPEHPQYADDGSYPAPPPKADATPRTCDFGDNPLTPAVDEFVCNDKLISGEPFLDSYNAALPGAELYPDSARDSDGHGTHTSTTAAGGPVAETPLYGADRGAIHGLAPGAHVAVYKVCGRLGCYSSDSTAAVGQAILDGVDVVNFSISGGTNPFTDPVELAFLDAYAAGVFVAASAGNDGPGASTANHLAPWVTTVAASTQARAFTSTLTLSDGAASVVVTGTSITAGVSAPTPVVKAADVVGYADALCSTEPPPGLFSGQVVVCERGVTARVAKGRNLSIGGAAGMILYNPYVGDTETDNHWVPSVHLDGDEGTAVLGFLAAHPGATATFTDSSKNPAAGDVVAAFSSRGPAGDYLKPDVTAPGVQILAGNTPTPDYADDALGPPGEYYQAIAGTSMSSPHVAGAAALLKALHPDWTPGQVKSALMTTATTAVVKEDGVTPADPFDVGAGRIDLDRAGDPGLVLDETADAYAASAGDPVHRIDLNLPSVDAPVMPGKVVTHRTVRNVTDHPLHYFVGTTHPDKSEIGIWPNLFTIAPGATKTVEVTIWGPGLADGQYFGEIWFDEIGGPHDIHLPVAWYRQQGDVKLALACAPTTIRVSTGRSRCTTTATNESFGDVDVDLTTTVGRTLTITSASGATRHGARRATAHATLAGKQPGLPSIAPGALFGYMDLEDFGVPADAVGDEEIVNYDVPPFEFAGETYTSVGVTSNGYVVVGGGGSTDVDFVPQTLPDPVAPNNVLAPFWTDLDGSADEGLRATALCDGADCWLVVQWDVDLWGTDDHRTFQAWIGLNGVEDITFAYDPAAMPAAPPPGYGLTVGAENVNGSAGGQIAEAAPSGDYRVTSAPGAPGGSYSYSVRVRGLRPAWGYVASRMTSPALVGTTIENARVKIVRPPRHPHRRR